MNDSYLASHPYITVAVAFDQHTPALVQAAYDLARRLRKRVCLVHVLEPWTELAVARPLETASPLWNSMLAVETSARAKAVERLESFARLAPPDVAVKTSVASGSPARALAAEAATVGTYLLLVGARSDAHKILPVGVSTGIALLSSSPVPVLVVDTAAHVPRFAANDGGTLRLLLADDLTEQSEASVAYAAGLADAYGGAWIHHVFVSAVARDTLHVALQNAATAGRTAFSEAESEQIFSEVRRRQLATLEERFDAFREYHEAGGGKYTSEVVAGGVALELGNVIEATNPDVLVFGRHRFVHTAPFAFGRMPFRAMLTSRRPVLVVPTL